MSLKDLGNEVLNGLHWVMESVDQWILSQFQAAANWLYTEFEVSPYLISAWLFGLFAMLWIPIAVDGGYYFGGPWVVLSSILWGSTAMHRHRRWASKGNAGPITMDVKIFRKISAFLAISMSLSLIMFLPAADLEACHAWATTNSLFAAYYFLSVDAPTRLEREDYRLVPAEG